MNCDVCQRRLLAATNPAAPSRSVRRHLAGCVACCAFQQRLLRIEHNIPALPVPPGRGKKRFLARFLGKPEPAPQPTPSITPTLPLPWWRRRGLVRVAGSVAAAVLIGCGVYLGVWLAQSVPVPRPVEPVAKGEPPIPDQDLVGRLLECDLRLAEAGTPRQRVETLAELADVLHRESRAVCQGGGARELQTLARLYERVIEQGVVPRAKEMPAGKERLEALKPIVAQLAQAEREARQLAERSAQKSAPTSGPLLQIAAAAKTADRQLRGLMEEVP
jgi:hypothetical protein